ncbi:MAG TPA: rhodanese-like domain-containing protein [Anaeromyxobacter sp.]|nr:rhodanese-like domain-containing protein [Anaeromyxobacter sp.]
MALLSIPWWLPLGEVPEVPATRLAQELTASPPPQIVDVRTAREFRNGRIPGAISAPLGSLARALPELGLDPGRRVVAICLTAHRSIPAVRLLRRHGFDAAQLRGGMLAWRAAGFREEKG